MSLIWKSKADQIVPQIEIKMFIHHLQVRDLKLQVVEWVGGEVHHHGQVFLLRDLNQDLLVL
jgi:hypothetical protein